MREINKQTKKNKKKNQKKTKKNAYTMTSNIRLT